MNTTADPFKRLRRFRLDDAALARAYHAVSDLDKSVFKRSIAAHFRLNPPEAAMRQERVVLPDGFAFVRVSRPVETVLLVLPDSPISPLKVLAALLPARTCGAPDVAVVKPAGSPWEDGTLTALELAGQEDVFAPDAAAWGRFCADLGKHPTSAALIDLTAGKGGLELPDNVRVWRAPATSSLGVFCEESEFDLACLVRCHPGSRLTVWNGPGRVRGTTGRVGEFPDFLAIRYDAVFVPASRLTDALERFPLAFGPGGEAHWFWPGLDKTFFSLTHLGCTDGE